MDGESHRRVARVRRSVGKGDDDGFDENCVEN